MSEPYLFPGINAFRDRDPRIRLVEIAELAGT
jgi:hypothetical protein